MGANNVEDKSDLIELNGISKNFGEVKALRNVDMELGRDEILGLVGDNGAGKSTLIKIISGVFNQSSGEMFFDDKPVRFDSPHEAREAGIRVVHQQMEEVLAPHQDVTSNLFMGEELTKSYLGGVIKVLDKKKMTVQAQEALDKTNIQIDSLERPVADYSGGQRQAVAVARAIREEPKVLILDEPTSALGVEESQEILSLIKRVGKQGISVIVISHDLDEVFDVVDRIFVLRNGEKAGERVAKESNKEEIVSLITGAIK